VNPNLAASVWWTLTLALMVIGLVGTVVPLLPGTTIILAAAIMHHFALGAEHSVSWWTLSGLVVLTVVSYVLDFVSGAIGAKKFGATRWGAIGGILGAIVGIFFGLPGIFFGPLAGVLVGELLGGKGLLPAGRSTWGTLLGTTVGMAAKLAIAALMIGWFVAAALL
jgi:uncharacterized protein YqgC (DUF456 family)